MPTTRIATLADGQLASSEGDIYIYGSSTTANQAETKVSHIFLFNTSAVTQTIDVFVKPSGGTSRQIRQVVLAQNESADVVGDGTPIILSPGAAIRAVTTTASVVDYAISGEVVS